MPACRPASAAPPPHGSRPACSRLTSAGLLLREAIEDLEWTGGEVEFVMHRSPMRFVLQSSRQQSLKVGGRAGGWWGL